MYHVANSKMDQVTNSAMGKNIMEYMSIFREMGILKLGINCHSQWVAMLSAPEWMKIVVGIRLIRKAVLMVLAMDMGEFFRFRRGGRIIGVRRVSSVNVVRVLRSSGVSITFTWICTKIGGS